MHLVHNQANIYTLLAVLHGHLLNPVVVAGMVVPSSALKCLQ